MIHTRESAWSDGSGWNDVLHWYAIGVREVQKRDFTDRLSWRFLAAIHGVSGQDWSTFGFLTADDAIPDQADIDLFFSKCQHGSWYFLPWHRGYLSAFERIIRAAIVDQGGPDDWALPYWNYNDPDFADARTIPSPFTAELMPDGSPNALFSPFRFGNAAAGGALTVPEAAVDLSALKEPVFAPNVRLPGGFGGGEWSVDHSGGAMGDLEGVPHGPVHGVIGGQGVVQGRRVRGLMGAFETAGLDPIFWLHHCNIDRLWEVWLNRDPAHANPTQADWLGGPSNRPFVMPDPQGNAWHFSCGEMVDTTASPLEYVYDDISDPLADAGGVTETLATSLRVQGATVDWEDRDTELISNNDAAVAIGKEGVTTNVPVPGEQLRASASKFLQETLQPGEVERYFLVLSNVSGEDNSGLYEVFIDYGEPGQEMPSGLPRELKVGSFSTFGISVESEAEGTEGQGLSLRFNITPVIERMGIDEEPELAKIQVRIAPVTQSDEVEPPKIGRIAVYREGA